MRVVRVIVAVLIVVAAVAMAASLLLTGGDGPGDGSHGASGQPIAGGQTIDVQNIKAEVPSDWDVLVRAGDTIAVKDKSARTLWLRSAAVATPLTVDAIQQRFLDKAIRETPDARICAGPESAVVPGGPVGGKYLVICSTFIPQGGGPAARFADAYYIGVDATGTTAFVMQLTAGPEGIQPFAATVRALPPPVWKLYRP
jgi:hypothetical protein